jgi:hypothetical protein
MNRHYRLGGLTIASDIDLSDWLPRQEGGDSDADIAIRLGRVPPRLDAPDHVAPVFETSGRGRCLLALPGTGRILLENGDRATFEPVADAELSAAAAVLAGPVQAVLWHQRGLLPLRATAVMVGGRALVFAGGSAVGKSTLAATLAARGHSVLSDAVCAFQPSGARGMSMLPGVTRLRLRRDALDLLGLPADAAARIRPRREEYLVDMRGPIASEAREVGALVVLTRMGTTPAAIERLRGHRAVGALREVIHARRQGEALGRRDSMFAALSRLAAAAPVWRLRFSEDPASRITAADKALAILEA